MMDANRCSRTRHCAGSRVSPMHGGGHTSVTCTARLARARALPGSRRERPQTRVGEAARDRRPCAARPGPTADTGNEIAVSGRRRVIAAAVVATIFALAAATPAPAASWAPPPVNAKFDYQIGGDYRLPRGASVVSRDWFSGA